MIVPDLNLVMFAYNPWSPFHSESRKWWESLMSGPEAVGLPMTVVLGFSRLMSSPKLTSFPFAPSRALEEVQEWLFRNHVTLIQPGPTHLEILHSLMVGKSAKLVMDAHIAALAIEHRGTVHTHDRDFERFPGLRVRYPLSG